MVKPPGADRTRLRSVERDWIPDPRARGRARANLEAWALERADGPEWFAEIIQSLGLTERDPAMLQRPAA